MEVDKNIDKLFKEGLKEAGNHIVFNEHDWTVLEERLDHAGKKNKRAIIWLNVISGIAAVLILGLALWYITPLEQPQQNAVVEKKESAKPLENKLDNTQSIAGSKKPQLNKGSISKEVSSNEVSLTHSKRKLFSLADEQEQLVESQGNVPDMLQLNNGTSASKQIITNSTNSNQRDTLKLVELYTMKPKSAKESRLRRMNPRRVTLSFSAAPALNGVNSFKDAQLGADIGMMLTVELTRKWSVSTGAIYAKKVYDTEFKNYNPNSAFVFKYKPQSIEADCRVLDIPLNVNYKVFSSRKNSMSVGAGLSSYFMLKEDYQFHYKYPRANDPVSYQVKNKNQHIMGVINLQASYEQRVNSKMSIGIQPFVKIPMNDIGYSKVKLQSVGVAINVNFDLNKSTKKGN